MAVSLLTVALLGTLSLLATVVLGYRLPYDPGLLRIHFLAAFASTTLLVMGHAFILFFLIAHVANKAAPSFATARVCLHGGFVVLVASARLAICRPTYRHESHDRSPAERQ